LSTIYACVDKVLLNATDILLDQVINDISIFCVIPQSLVLSVIEPVHSLLTLIVASNISFINGLIYTAGANAVLSRL